MTIKKAFKYDQYQKNWMERILDQSSNKCQSQDLDPVFGPKTNVH